MTRTIPAPSGSCRLCGRLAFGADAHPCCLLWAKTLPGVDCPACRQADHNNECQDRRKRTALLPLPMSERTAA